jgi:hypothetical protein
MSNIQARVGARCITVLDAFIRAFHATTVMPTMTGCKLQVRRAQAFVRDIIEQKPERSRVPNGFKIKRDDTPPSRS